MARALDWVVSSHEFYLARNWMGSCRAFLFMPQPIEEMRVMPKKKDQNAMTLHYIDRLSLALTKRNRRKYVRRE